MKDKNKSPLGAELANTRLGIILNIIKTVKCKKSGRLFAKRADNKYVFELLDLSGFFDFHTTNKGEIVGLSQIVAFYACGGYKALANGFTAKEGFVEVHHINGVTDDNRPENLVYLSKQDHILVSSSTNTPLVGKPKSEEPTPFNKQGEPVSNPIHFLANILQQTLAAVSNSRTGQEVKLALSIIKRGLPVKRLYNNLIRTYMPSWMSKWILKCIHEDNPYLRYNT
jgi:hypothetical protein